MFWTSRIKDLESAHNQLRREYEFLSERARAQEQFLDALLDHLKLYIDRQPAQLVVRKVAER